MLCPARLEVYHFATELENYRNQYCLFKQKPDAKIFESTVKTMLRIVAAKGKAMNETVQKLVDEALSDCIVLFTDL